jgi:C4-dicarboxylate-specific signal transduction histidine kinase
MTTSPDDAQHWLRDNWTVAGRFVRDVTHDVNNQLGAVLAYAELLALETGGREEVRGMVSEITTAVQRASLLMDTLASVPSPDLTTVQSVDLSAIARDALLLFEREADRRHVQVVAALPEGGAEVRGVHARLSRTLVHTLCYAFDYLETSGQLVDLRVQMRAGLDDIAVRISGPGIGDSSSGAALAEANEHARHHRGSIVLAPGSVTITIPRETGLS